MKFGLLPKSKLSKDEVTVPVMAASPDPTDGVTVTVDVFTFGLRASPLFEIPTPLTVYSHPVLMSTEFIVSVIVDSVSVWLVIEPCWKFGTTGTACAAVPPKLSSSSTKTRFIMYTPSV